MVAFSEVLEPETPSSPEPYGSSVVVATVPVNSLFTARPLVGSGVGNVEQDRGTFTGYVVDNETGLLHARARQYSPTLGRFVGRDSVGYIDGYSLYGAYFVPGRLDPSGNSPGTNYECNWDDDCPPERIAAHIANYKICVDQATDKYKATVKAAWNTMKGRLKESEDQAQAEKDRIEGEGAIWKDYEKVAMFMWIDWTTDYVKSTHYARYAADKSIASMTNAHDMRVCDLANWCRHR